MGWLDKVPRTEGGGLWIGGYAALYSQQPLFQQSKITHVISVLDYELYEAEYLNAYQRMHVKLDDDPNEDLLKHLPKTTAFIEEALSKGGAVFVHCAMGKSRSATVVIAYLMWKYNLTPDEALAQLREGRGVCEPNPGFMEQLDVYQRMLQAGNSPTAKKIYDTWVNERDLYRDWYAFRSYRRQAPAPKL
ncbi:hypothetical protein CERZMDRAFT_114129 [Cercospora zeae-maydis SCOH1-5]|uniref:protein-tyrosine-phosphatase n=1 Tax=Cercospora zeae-maydis SCOH1-5 TaxID=717836 RepID=A0A6A6F762_9PEZI|nr:hypothetical protein CERZMDRAFT_114129 [Cercospora zeae-maydis SCOH1-5]